MAAVTRRLGNRRSERALARLRSGPPLPIDAGSDPSVRPSTAALLHHAAWRRPVPESIEAVVADPAAIEAHHDLRRHLRLYRHAARAANPDTPPEIDFAAAQSALARLHDLATIAGRLVRLAGGADHLPGRVAEALAVDWRRARRVWNEIALETTAPGGPK